MKERIIFDIEANGLLDTVDKIWCISIYNIDTKESITYSDYSDKYQSISPELIEKTFTNKIIIGHNIIRYDIPLVKLIYGIDLISLVKPENIIDTYIWSATLHPDRTLPRGCPNFIFNPVTKLKQKIGPHGLESWGWRVGEKKIEISDWNKFNESILTRCEIDVKINEKVYYELCKEGGIIYENGTHR